MTNILAIAAAGALGTLARYGLSGLAHQWLGARFAWGTLAVNLLGCLVLGVLMQLALTTDAVPQPWRLPLAIGFCGAFTTFSTFGYETLRFVEDGAWGLAVGNVAANVVGGLALTWLGFVAARAMTGGAM
ncbi:MAG TPA: fluoride efflux transporter CrcB [Firmicutes bacterium]|nr:fluoride efflux transporter CrcB [Bacillota bacterium]